MKILTDNTDWDFTSSIPQSEPKKSDKSDEPDEVAPLFSAFKGVKKDARPDDVKYSGLSTNDYFNAVYKDTIRSISRYVAAKCSHLLDIEDVIQNVYTRFFSRITKKGHTDIDSAEAFLINIAKFETRNYFSLLKNSSNKTSFSDFSDEQMVLVEEELSRSNKNLELVLENEMLARKIFEDIANSDPDTGKIFYMHFALDMKLEDIAKALDIKLSNVKNKLYRTIERQRKKFNL